LKKRKGKKMKVKIDLKKCTGCSKCLESCPFEAIKIVSEKAVIDFDKCQVCGACESSCGRGAITLVDG